MTTISQERSKLAALGVELRRREQWGARFNYTNSRPVDEPATRVFVHITVTEPGNYASFDAHARAIENIGINRFPNTGISYNRLFMAGTRTVYEGQPIGRRGAHTVNDFKRSTCSTSGCPSRGGSLTAPSWNLNINARSYVYCANVHHGVPDHVIDDMARVIAADKLAGFVTKGAQIHGHRCVSSKSCPGDKMWARMGELNKLVDHYLKAGLEGADMPITDADAKKIASANWHYLMGRPGGGEDLYALTYLRYGWWDGKTILKNQAKQLVELAAIKQAVGAVIDKDAVAQQVAALTVPAVVAALAGVVPLTEQQVEDAAEQAIRNVLGTLDES